MPLRSNDVGRMIAGSARLWKQTALFLLTCCVCTLQTSLFNDFYSMKKSSEVGLIILYSQLLFCALHVHSAYRYFSNGAEQPEGSENILFL